MTGQNVGVDYGSPCTRISGYRVVRRLHSGARTDVYLGENEEHQTVALRIFERCGGAEMAASELLRGEKVSSDHLPQIIDVGVTDDQRTVLVSERLSSPLSARLSSDVQVAAGSVVSLLSGIGQAVASFHKAGLVHGNITSAHIRFQEDGCPILVGDDGGSPATPSSIADDLLELAVVTEQLLLRTDLTTRKRGIHELVDWLKDRSHDLARARTFAEEWECRVFALADPLPFALGNDDASPASQAPTRREVSRARRHRRRKRPLSSLVSSLVSVCRSLHMPLLRRAAENPRRVRLALIALAVFTIVLLFGITMMSGSKDDAAPPTQHKASAPLEDGPQESADSGARPLSCQSVSELRLFHAGLHAGQVT